MSEITTKTITIARSAYYTVGVRLWFVIQDTEGVRYQRWSFNMDASDEVLMLLQPKDTATISYVPQTNPSKNVITNVEFV